MPPTAEPDQPRSTPSRPVASSARLRAVPSNDESGETSSTSAAEFSEAVRVVLATARRARLEAPVFRSPPRLDGVDRTIRRRPTGAVVVAIRRDGRPFAAVRSDVIEGVVAANGLKGADADSFRRVAWSALEGGTGSRRPGRASMAEPHPARVA